MQDEELLTSTEVARLLRVHPKHLYRLLRQGLPGHRVGRGNWKFKREEVLAWLDARGRAGRSRAAGLELSVPHPVASRRWFAGRVRGRWVGHVAASDHPHAADALTTDAEAPTTGSVSVSATRTLDEIAANLLVAGCAPLLGIVLDRVDAARPRGRAHWLSVNSTAALRLLADGFVHAAGIHLAEEGASDHVEIVRRLLPGRPFHLVHVVRWRLGIVVQRRNPKGIASIEDLARSEIRTALREEGSGVRRVFDRSLRRVGVKRRRVRSGATLPDHRAVATAVALDAADAGLTVEAAAVEVGLPFVPLVEEAFDLVVPLDVVDGGHLGPLLDGLSDPELRREVTALGPYDATRMGSVRTVA